MSKVPVQQTNRVLEQTNRVIDMRGLYTRQGLNQGLKIQPVLTVFFFLVSTNMEEQSQKKWNYVFRF
jgi:hypothetical protein